MQEPGLLTEPVERVLVNRMPGGVVAAGFGATAGQRRESVVTTATTALQAARSWIISTIQCPYGSRQLFGAGWS
ncbi:hypothetical protein [Streptomyces ipomoeae]|uniref:hypothetical protein n=1 Tax=Streptomyces ipomoeae TaxID=103232 RepID=UPI0015F04D1C|nr:hypothetical protein [Streptomyces ipomoeae]MDX2932172.1 hypothetical protein [Streptomyces ipomoeae]